MEFNKCTFPCTNYNNIDAVKNVKAPYFQTLNQCFFKCFCTAICSATKRLDMRGFKVYEKIRRNLQNIDIHALLDFLKDHQDITHVNLANNNISDSGFISLLDHLILHKNIEELDLQNNNIADLGIKYMRAIGDNLEIKSLNLKANKFGVDAAIDVAFFLLENKHIDNLNVAEVNQTASSLIYFMMVLSSDQEIFNGNLKSLDIGRPNPGCMYYFDSTHFADVIGHMLRHNTTLKVLHLQKYNFDCHDIESMMSNAIHNNSLHLLDLGCNNIGDHGIDHITKWLMKKPPLKTLILSRNILTDHGARSLSFAIPFSKLLSLDISYNKITDDGMVYILYTLKKCPMLRQLKIFGNCIGHSAAKILKRMLISQTLKQENIDVRPYRVDHRWYFAQYTVDFFKKEYVDVPYGLFSQVPKLPSIKATRPRNKYYKYTYMQTTNVDVKHSVVTMISQVMSKPHVKDCRCCYCFKCQTTHYNDTCATIDHSHTCCKCKGDESSDWSIDKSIIDKLVSPDFTRNIEYILKRVNSTTEENIVRWINIDEDVLEEDLKHIKYIVSEESSEVSIPCTCSWAQLNVSALQKYLQESPSKDLLVIPKNVPIRSKKVCKHIKRESLTSWD
ncbi:Leucine-rich repeat-containing protein 34 [Anthophora quadrimaculata]